MDFAAWHVNTLKFNMLVYREHLIFNNRTDDVLRQSYYMTRFYIYKSD